MTAMTRDDVLEAAAYALVGRRCRNAYMHDLRGGLQSLHGAIELLARSAAAGQNPAMVEKVSAMAKRAMATHERFMADVMYQLAPHDEVPTVVNLSETLAEVVRFLRNDALSQSVSFRLTSTPELLILAPAHKCRLLLLGLCALAIDDLAPGAVIGVTAAPSGACALIEFTGLAQDSRAPVGDTWPGDEDGLQPIELLLTMLSRWASGNGGRLEIGWPEQAAAGRSPLTVKIYHPLAT